jgi:hypothetical protein
LSVREVVEAAIDLDLRSLSNAEIEGGYRSLCGAMLLRAAQELGLRTQPKKICVEAKKISRAWLFRGGGVISFSEACEACSMDQRKILSQIVEYSDRLLANPRGQGSVFGRPPA